MVPKINTDLESLRHQRNMTNNQKKADNQVKEGLLVNSYVKDPLLSLDQTYDTLVISKNAVPLPEKLTEKDSKKINPLLPLCGITLGVASLFGIFTAAMKRFSKSRLESSKEFLLPGMTRNHCINDEIHQSIFSMIQSPNRKTILAAFGVITLASMAFLAKTFIDGFKDVWVKRQKADIQKNLQENLIEVETQSFSGKLQIIRSMLSEKAKELSKELTFKGEKTVTKNTSPNNGTSFSISQNGNNTNRQSGLHLVLGGLTLFVLMGLSYFSLRNIRKSDEFIKNGIKNTKKGIELVVQDFNNGKPLTFIGHHGETLTGKDAYKGLIENMLDSIYATPKEVRSAVDKLNLPTEEKEEFIKHLEDMMNQSMEKINPMMGGSGRNKISYYSHVNDTLSFFYDWLMNPNNSNFRNLFMGIAGTSVLGYLGKTASEAVKDVQVEKYSAEVELNLQKRLVATELRNFKSKKDSAIEPLVQEFYNYKHAGKSPEELKVIADNILFEVKNGPPFVYT